jgi:hypothetical protein
MKPCPFCNCDTGEHLLRLCADPGAELLAEIRKLQAKHEFFVADESTEEAIKLSYDLSWVLFLAEGMFK